MNIPKAIGWTPGDGSGHEGYNVADYFRDGKYLGPDEHGIEPVFSEPQAELDRAYVQLLEARINRNKTTMLTALMYCSIGALDRAQQALSQGVNDL